MLKGVVDEVNCLASPFFSVVLEVLDHLVPVVFVGFVKHVVRKVDYWVC